MKSFFTHMLSKIKQLRYRTIVLAVLLILLFSVPTILAIRSTKSAEAPVVKPTFSVTLSNESGTPFASGTASEDPTNGTNLADIFYRIITEGDPIDSPPFPSEEGVTLHALVNQNGTISEYVCYFSTAKQSGYYLDSKQQIFSMTASAVTDFLLLSEAESVYDNATPPILLTNTAETVMPSSAEWFYKLYNNTYKRASQCKTTDANASYEFAGALELKFANAPDVCTIRAVERETGTTVYEGALEGLSLITVNPGMSLQISIRAQWDEKEDTAYYGALSYNFSAVIRDRSTFTLNKHVFAPGDFLILTCTNVQSIDKLSFQCEYELTRYAYIMDRTVFFVILYPSEILSSTMNFTVTYGATANTFTVSLLEQPTTNDITIEEVNNIIEKAISKQAQAELSTLLSTQYPSASILYFPGNIHSMAEYGFTQGYVFGDPLIIPDQEEPITASGTEYLAANGTAIPAITSGKVVATGHSDALGNYVVLDHGLGIQTWYAHLSDFNVHKGDIVAVGQSIGKAGIGGVYTDSGVLILCTVNGHLCNPSSIIP